MGVRGQDPSPQPLHRDSPSHPLREGAKGFPAIASLMQGGDGGLADFLLTFTLPAHIHPI